jgi:hypothetical protein
MKRDKMNTFKNIFKDGNGNMSSFRIVWAITVLTIFFTWSYSCIATKSLHQLPLDGLGIIALLGASPLKTQTEKSKSTE